MQNEMRRLARILCGKTERSALSAVRCAATYSKSLWARFLHKPNIFGLPPTRREFSSGSPQGSSLAETEHKASIQFYGAPLAGAKLHASAMKDEPRDIALGIPKDRAVLLLVDPDVCSAFGINHNMPSCHYVSACRRAPFLHWARVGAISIVPYLAPAPPAHQHIVTTR